MQLSFLIVLAEALLPAVTQTVAAAIAGEDEEASDGALAGLVAAADAAGDRIPGWSRFPAERREQAILAAVYLLDMADDAARGDYDGDGVRDKVPVSSWLLRRLQSRRIDLRTLAPVD